MSFERNLCSISDEVMSENKCFNWVGGGGVGWLVGDKGVECCMTRRKSHLE